MEEIKRNLFMAKIQKKEQDECWEWQGALDAGGYGTYKATSSGVAYKAHRVSLSYHLGRPLTIGAKVLHSCDNRKCCNPHHLREGTTQENKADEVSRNRQTRGENHPHAKFTDSQVVRLRVMAINGASLKQLAYEFDISYAQASAIARGVQRKSAGGPIRDKSWHHGEDTPSAKITAEQAREIRNAPGTHTDIAKKYGVSRRLVGMIKSRERWAHID